MLSTEFLAEAEQNLAHRKIEKYLDMIPDEALRALILMLRGQENISEASGDEANKIQYAIRSLTDEEKQEFLSRLSKEAKTRPASKATKAQKKSSPKQPSKKKTKNNDKGPGVFKGCLLPILGIIGLLSLVPDSPQSASSDTEQTASADVVDPFTHTDGAEYHVIKVRNDLENPNVKIYVGKRISAKSEEELSALGLSKESYSIYAVDLKNGKGIKIKPGFQTDFDDEASALAQFNRGIPTGGSYDLDPGSTQAIRYTQLRNKFNNGN